MPVLSSVPSLLLVALGGGLGSMLRYMVGRWALGFGAGLPLGTWTVNIVGGFAMGMLAGWLARAGATGEGLRLFLGVGVLGGFTTFSAFSLEVFAMINRGEIGLAAAYSVSSVAGAVLAVMTGIFVMRA